MAQGRGAATKATLAIGLVMLVLLLNCELAESENIIVGGSHGWAFDVAYWTNGKTFHPGDILIFKYQKGYHNVMQVNSDDYAKCKSDNPIKTFSSGNDRIWIGRDTYYFICGIGNHCSVGNMKIKIDVSEH